jgi:hypothetical protein
MTRPIATRTRTILTLVGVAAFALSGCARLRHDGADGSDDPGSDSSGVGMTAGQPSGGADTVGNQSGNGGKTHGSPSASASASAAASGAQIVYFKVTHQPACPVVATADAPFSAPGQDLTIAWKVTGATGVALSVDNPNYYASNNRGSFGSYGPEQSQTIGFGCDTSVPNSTHKYTINTTGGGASKSMTITVTVPSSP